MLVLQVDPECKLKKTLVVESRHVLRAYEVLRLCHDVISLWRTGSCADKAVPGQEELRCQLSSADRFAMALSGAKWPSSQYATFQLSQVAPEIVPEGSGNIPHEVPSQCDGKALPEILTQIDVPNLHEGYGEGGKFVQDVQDGEIIFTDRVPWLYCRWLVGRRATSQIMHIQTSRVATFLVTSIENDSYHCLFHLDIEFARSNSGDHVAHFDARRK